MAELRASIPGLRIRETFRASARAALKFLAPAEPVLHVTLLSFAVSALLAVLVSAVHVSINGPYPSASLNLMTVDHHIDYVLLASGTVAYLSYLAQVWKARQTAHRALMYLLVGFGGTLIPLSVSYLNFQNYRSNPADYIIPADKLPYVRYQSDEVNKGRLLEINRLSRLTDRLEAALNDHARIGPVLHYASNDPQKERCPLLALGSHTGLLCTTRRATPVGRGNVVYLVELHADADYKASRNSRNLSPVVTGPAYHCPFHPILSRSMGMRKKKIDRDKLFTCIRFASEGMQATVEQLRGEVQRSRTFPYLPYTLVLLDSTSAIVGGKYSVLEPVAPRAALISIGGGALVFAYFVLFASLVLDAEVKRRRIR